MISVVGIVLRGGSDDILCLRENQDPSALSEGHGMDVEGSNYPGIGLGGSETRPASLSTLKRPSMRPYYGRMIRPVKGGEQRIPAIASHLR